MHMVRHHAIGKDRGSVMNSVLIYDLQIVQIIVIPQKGILLAVPPLGNMMRISDRYRSCAAWHGGMITGRAGFVKKNRALSLVKM